MGDSARLEQCSRAVTQMQRVLRDFHTQSDLVGGDKDTNFQRQKIAKLRQRFAELDSQATLLLKEVKPGGPDDRTWNQMRDDVKAARGEFERADRETRAKEKAHQPKGAGGAAAGETGTAGAAPAAGGGGHHAVKMQDFKQVDMRELATEEQLQREKLKGVLEVEGDIYEIKSMYQEFHGMVTEQQGGLDTMETNIDKSTAHVEKGVVEMKEANRLQKSSRKKLCILIAIVIAVGIVAVVIYFIVKKA